MAEHDPKKCGCEYRGNDCWSCGHIDHMALKGFVGPDTNEPSPIIVVVVGGVVQNISGIPDGLTVHVRDYDVDGQDIGPNAKTDENGDNYFLGVWQ